MPRPWTVAEYRRAEELHAQGLDWPAVADRLGRSVTTLRSIVCRIRKGKYPLEGRGAEHRKMTAAMLRMAEEGHSARAIAAHFGITPQHACVRLAYHGCDAEVRREYRHGV